MCAHRYSQKLEDTQSKSTHDNTGNSYDKTKSSQCCLHRLVPILLTERLGREGGPLCMHSFLWAVESVIFNSSQGVKDEIYLNNGKNKNSVTTSVKNPIK